MVRASVVTGPSKYVCVEPSTRRLTVTGAAVAAAPEIERKRSAQASADESEQESHPFPRGRMCLAVGGGLLAPGPFRRAFPDVGLVQWLRSRASDELPRSQWRAGGPAQNPPPPRRPRAAEAHPPPGGAGGNWPPAG